MFEYGPRERLLEKGAGSLSDQELLCVLLGTGPKGVMDLAERLLERFGDLRSVLSARPEELENVFGVGRSKRSLLLGVGEIALRLWRTGRGKEQAPVTSASQAYYLFSDLALEDQEVVVGAFLNSRNQLIRRSRIFRGTLDSSLARPREILREALRANSAKLLLAHNHPSQVPEPSDEDIQLTSQLERASKAVGIPLIDHLIICGGGRYFSFAEAKLIEQPIPGRGRRLGRRPRGDPAGCS
jgi:DNA repair protein RadC